MVSVELTAIEPRSDSRQFPCNKSSQSYPSAPANSYLILNGPTVRASLVWWSWRGLNRAPSSVRV